MVRIAMISPNKAAWSETFIRAQVAGLPTEVDYLYGAFLPRYRPDGRHFVSDNRLVEGLLYHGGRLLGMGPHGLLRKRILRYLRDRECKAVLAQYGPTGVEMADLCLAANIPLIVHFHGHDATNDALLAAYGGRYPRMFRQAAAIIAVSEAMRKQLISMGAPPEKVHRIPCGADTELFQPAKPAENPPLMLAVGRFVPTKNPMATLEAFAKVVAEVPETRLMMAGEGPLRAAVERRAAALGLAAQVEFPGVLDHAGVARQMQKARAFVQHSVTAPSGESEGTPVAVMEAGASALPVIATRHAGIPDVVVHGQTGLLVAEGDVDGMAAFMRQLAQDPALAARLGAAARQRIEAEFSLKRALARLWEVIEAAMK